MVKIIAGEFRTRILLSPEGEDRTRPMTARVKESVFAMLHGWFEGARVLDLFAGVGTVGIECASRGAVEVVSVERDREVFRYLEHNIATLGCGDRVKALQADALGPTALARSPKPVDLVFMDPPYALMTEPATRKLVLAQAARTRDLFAPKGFLVLRTPIDLVGDERAIPGFDGPESHRYKDDMWVYLYAPSAAGVLDGLGALDLDLEAAAVAERDADVAIGGGVGKAGLRVDRARCVPDAAAVVEVGEARRRGEGADPELARGRARDLLDRHRGAREFVPDIEARPVLRDLDAHAHVRARDGVLEVLHRLERREVDALRGAAVPDRDLAEWERQARERVEAREFGDARIEVGARARRTARVGAREAEVARGRRRVRVADHDVDARRRRDRQAVAGRRVDRDGCARVDRLDRGVQPVEDIAHRIGGREVDRERRAPDLDLDRSGRDAAAVRAAEVGEARGGGHRRIEVAVALDAAREGAEGLRTTHREADVGGEAEVGAHAEALALVADSLAEGREGRARVRVAAEEVDPPLLAVRDREEGVDHRVDDRRLVAPRRRVAADADLREADSLRLLQDVADIGERGVEGVEGRVGLREVPDALLAALDGVVEDGDRRRADRVLRRAGELLAGREPDLQGEQVAVRVLDAGKRNSRRKLVRNAGEDGRNCAHADGPAEGGQGPCRGSDGVDRRRSRMPGSGLARGLDERPEGAAGAPSCQFRVTSRTTSEKSPDFLSRPVQNAHDRAALWGARSRPLVQRSERVGGPKGSRDPAGSDGQDGRSHTARPTSGTVKANRADRRPEWCAS